MAMDSSECHRVLGLEEWLQEFRLLWTGWAAKLSVLQSEDDDEVVSTIEDTKRLYQLIKEAQQQRWEDTRLYIRLWEQAFSGLPEVVRDCKRLAQLAQQEADGCLTAVVSETLHLLWDSLSCLLLCPREYLRSMPAAQQQLCKVLLQFYLTAGPQLLLGRLAAEHGSEGQGRSSYLWALAVGLQGGTSNLIQLPLSGLKRSERSSFLEGVGRMVDALEVAPG